MKLKDDFKVPFWPEPIKLEEFSQGLVFTLRGPRQVGKTRFLKHLVTRAAFARRMSFWPVGFCFASICRTGREGADAFLIAK